MNTVVKAKGGLIVVGILAVLLLVGISAAPVQAIVDGIEGTTFDLVAKQDTISSPDGDSILMWGYADGGARMQYPGPTLIVQQGDIITVNLTNELPVAHGQNVSIVFPGHVVTASGGVAGALTNEAPPDGATAVTYTFEATHPGTYHVQKRHPAGPAGRDGAGGRHRRASGGTPVSVPDPRPIYGKYPLCLQPCGYSLQPRIPISGDGDRCEDPQYGGKRQPGQVDTTTWYPVTWLVNGRAFPDLLQSPGVPWFPTQPYNIVPRIHPFETMLIRVVGAGRAQHPMHYHGEDFSVIGINGRMLSSDGGASGPDLAWKASTFNFTPGQTADMLWEWHGSDLGWDVYGHAPGDPVLVDYEDADMNVLPLEDFPGPGDVDHNGNGIFEPGDHGHAISGDSGRTGRSGIRPVLERESFPGRERRLAPQPPRPQ